MFGERRRHMSASRIRSEGTCNPVVDMQIWDAVGISLVQGLDQFIVFFLFLSLLAT